MADIDVHHDDVCGPGWGGSWLGRAFGRVILQLSKGSTWWPVRSLVVGQVRRLGGRYFTVVADDGVCIDALYLPGRVGAGKEKLPVVIAHGWLETKEFHLREARMFVERGHSVVLVDLRAHGRSSGGCTTFGVREKNDIAAVISDAQQHGWVKDRVVTYGYSLGAGVMLQHAAIDERVVGVVAMASFRDMAAAVVSFHYALGRVIDLEFVLNGIGRAAEDYGFEMQEASPLEAMEDLKVPVLFVVGCRDCLLPGADHTRVLADAYGSGSCRVIQVPGAGHTNLCYRAWPGLDEQIAGFCEEPGAS